MVSTSWTIAVVLLVSWLLGFTSRVGSTSCWLPRSSSCWRNRSAGRGCSVPRSIVGVTADD
ncbi:DUF5670 family protein [Sphingomonas hominis]|uniref:DUF5670 family protein n=1 Tax=Sphingomonas hominis TaxID=2741495 RepID=UPI003CCD4B53